MAAGSWKMRARLPFDTPCLIGRLGDLCVGLIAQSAQALENMINTQFVMVPPLVKVRKHLRVRGKWRGSEG